ncbi:hypothetical protein Ae201684P_004635 [Aphanomyces euteiches]|nr:hypothetical protein Ae201684P_004635 [Aphanomyces euteiches]
MRRSMKRVWPAMMQHRRSLSTAKQRVIVGMSGGVDSSVAAYLLHQDKSFHVKGVYMNNWDSSDEEGQATCPADLEYESVRQVCSEIGISCTRVDFVQEYWNNVFSPCLDEYAQGWTPNPDLLCNREIKFDAFARYAHEHLGADWIATGHYAQLKPADAQSSALALYAAVDGNKDQSYFLSHVHTSAFQKVRFPLGALTKPQVRAIATDANLSAATAKESMGICFIGKRPFGSFLAQYVAPRVGHFESIESGKRLHAHDGFSSYTIGQGAKYSGQPVKWFVVGKREHDAAILIAPGTHHPALFSDHALVPTKAFNWITLPPLALDQPSPQRFQCWYRARYRQPLSRCTVTISSADEMLASSSTHQQRPSSSPHNLFLHIEFDVPQRAIAPGQSIVLYRDDGLCFGGGAVHAAGPSYFEMSKPLPSPLPEWSV